MITWRKLESDPMAATGYIGTVRAFSYYHGTKGTRNKPIELYFYFGCVTVGYYSTPELAEKAADEYLNKWLQKAGLRQIEWG